MTRTPRARLGRAGALGAAALVALTACSSAASPAGSGPTDASAAATSALAGACGDTVDVQLPWWPGVDYAFLFQLIDGEGTVDTDENVYSGEIGDTGVHLRLRSGGPAAGYQTGQSVYYQDPDIDLVVEGQDGQVSLAGDLPTVSVFSYYDTYPVVFLWGEPSWDFRSLADVRASGAPVLAYGSSSYVTALEQSGDLDPAQVDGSFDGSPSRFVAEGGAIVQQDYITTAPYLYQHATDAWNKPVELLSLNSAYPIYQTTLQVRSDRLESYGPCLTELVPLVQQAAVDYALDPTRTNEVLADYTAQLPGVSVVLDADLLQSANAAQLKYGLVRNGTDGTFGSFDLGRVQDEIDLLTPAFEASGTDVPDLAPEDIATNQFLDPSIALPDDVPVPENDLPDDVPGLDLD
ncbi:hypothetical protein KQI48_11575 [Cellulomonas hominis]|jgi:hypothetical protein|uniref:hypothetical protein n=1 Tax=Cellulomonas hominis TaxID=156981 RepID=UPI001C10B008|nr:hypothetical protein [Cellulomonas hominis]MBU5423307.1 hypothetical protein [Cellulomonas hominis]